MEKLSIEAVIHFLTFHDFDLLPTQKKLCLPILQRIHGKMKIGVLFEGINIDGNLLINGHHRYLCALLLQKNLGRNAWRSPSHIQMYNWKEIEIDTNDWESYEIVQRHNAKDAERNNIDISIFNSL